MQKNVKRDVGEDAPHRYRRQGLRGALASLGSCDLIPEPRSDRLRDILFRDLYGLPASACIRISLGEIRSYLPIFGARCGWQSELTRTASAIVNRIDAWLQKSDGKPVKVPRFPENLRPDSDQNFTNAIDTVCKMVRSTDRDAGRRAVRTEWILWCCILQRKENVWAADDPLAAAADRARSEFRELACAGERADAEREYELRVAAMCDYLRGQELEHNLPAAAAEWREWRRICDLLEVEIKRYPEAADPTAFEIDLKRRERNELYVNL